MQKHIFLIIILLTFFANSCSRAPLTGRRQFNLVPDSQMLSMSTDEYRTFLSKNKPITSGKDADMVKTVGNKIAAAVNSYLSKNKKTKDMAKDFKWEFNLVDSKEVNAWCMPGGKVAVYTGLLPVAQSEAGLAVVMGHEIAHAVAKHGSERMTQGLLQQFGGTALSFALQNKPAETQNLFMNAYGVGTNVGLLLPFSRKQESEADELGLIFMAMAGYDPNEAVAFWQRMDKSSKGGAPPQILSTHPSHSTRIADIKKLIPKAMKYYGNGTSTATPTSSGGGRTKATPSTTPAKNTGTPTKPKTNNGRTKVNPK